MIDARIGWEYKSVTKPLCWIGTVDRDDAEPELAAAYDEVSRGDGSVHNKYQAAAMLSNGRHAITTSGNDRAR